MVNRNKEEEDDMDLTIGGVPIGKSIKKSGRWTMVGVIISFLTLLVTIVTLAATIYLK